MRLSSDLCIELIDVRFNPFVSLYFVAEKPPKVSGQL